MLKKLYKRIKLNEIDVKNNYKGVCVFFKIYNKNINKKYN